MMHSAAATQKTVLLPIEIQTRDFPPRFFLGCVAARWRNMRAIIGHESKLAAVAADLPRGSWLFKSITIEDLADIIRLRQLGYAIFNEDAESAGFYSDVFLRFRVEPAAIPLLEGMFVWGRYHQEICRQTFPEMADRFFVTGSPRFDLLRTEFRPLLQSASNELTARFGRFVLFNSSFNTETVGEVSRQDLDRLYRLYSPSEEVFRCKSEARAHKDSLFPRFVMLIEELANRIPNTKFILRPHPVESVAKWRNLLQKVGNVAVEKEGPVLPWLWGSQAVLHMGCTTGLESLLLGRPSFRYAPLPEPPSFAATYGFINLFNESFTDVERLSDALDHVLEGGRYLYPDRIQALETTHLGSEPGSLAADRMLDHLCRGAEGPANPKILRHAEARLAQHLATRASKAPNFRPEYSMAKYQGMQLAILQQGIDDLCRFHPDYSGLKVRELGDQIFELSYSAPPRRFDLGNPAPGITHMSISNNPPSETEQQRPSPSTPAVYTRTAPHSRIFGLENGPSICRYYIDRFLEKHRQAIRGDVLEIGDNRYTKAFGQNVVSSFVLSRDRTAPNVVMGDLVTGESVPSERFDCIICTQTLQVIFEIQQAVRHAVGALKTGGTLLVTASGISQISQHDFQRWGEYWRLTTQSMEKLLQKAAPDAAIEVDFYGNLAAAQAYLDGIPAEGLSTNVLDVKDPDYQCLVVGVLRKTGAQAVAPVAPEPVARLEVAPDKIQGLRQYTDHSKSYRVDCGGFTFHTNALPSLATELDLIFRRGIYDFQAVRPDPFVIDGGSHIGSFTLYTLKKYPAASALVFEPEAKSWKFLQENLSANLSAEQLQQVRTVQSGLFHYDGMVRFESRAADGSTIFSTQSTNEIQVKRLSSYLDRPVDFLKLNIEGAELEVLEEIESKLHLVRELCFEYHGFAEVGQRLHRLLDILHRNGFRYLINDFGREINPVCQPPFRIDANTRFYLLVYARRLQDTPPPL